MENGVLLVQFLIKKSEEPVIYFTSLGTEHYRREQLRLHTPKFISIKIFVCRLSRIVRG